MQDQGTYTMLVTGYAKAPQGTGMYEQYTYAGVVLEVDPGTGRIVDADFTAVTALARDFFKRIVCGHRLGDGFDELLVGVREHYIAPSGNAIITALKAANIRFTERMLSAETLSVPGVRDRSS